MTSYPHTKYTPGSFIVWLKSVYLLVSGWKVRLDSQQRHGLFSSQPATKLADLQTTVPSELKRTYRESSTLNSIKEDDWNFISIAHKQKQSQEILPLGARLCCTV
jgi:hypothetical protein